MFLSWVLHYGMKGNKIKSGRHTKSDDHKFHRPADTGGNYEGNRLYCRLILGSIVTIFILTKLMGYRQMSQMSMFDYINSRKGVKSVLM